MASDTVCIDSIGLDYVQDSYDNRHISFHSRTERKVLTGGRASPPFYQEHAKYFGGISDTVRL